MAELSPQELQALINNGDWSRGERREIEGLANKYFGYEIKGQNRNFDLREDDVSEFEQRILGALPGVHAAQQDIDFVNAFSDHLATARSIENNGPTRNIDLQIQLERDALARDQVDGNTASAEIRQQRIEQYTVQREQIMAQNPGPQSAEFVRGNMEHLREMYQRYMPELSESLETDQQLRENLSLLTPQILTQQRLVRDTASPMPTRTTPGMPDQHYHAMSYYQNSIGDEIDGRAFNDFEPLLITASVPDNPNEPNGPHTDHTMLVQHATGPGAGISQFGTQNYLIIQDPGQMAAYLQQYQQAHPDFKLQHLDGSNAATGRADPVPPTPAATVTPTPTPSEPVAAAPAATAAVDPGIPVFPDKFDAMINSGTAFDAQSLTALHEQMQTMIRDGYQPSPNDRNAVIALQRETQLTGTADDIRVTAQIGQSMNTGRLLYEGNDPLGINRPEVQAINNEIRQSMLEQVLGTRPAAAPPVASTPPTQTSPSSTVQTFPVPPQAPITIMPLPPLTQTQPGAAPVNPTTIGASHATVETPRLAWTKPDHEVAGFDPQVQEAQRVLSELDPKYNEILHAAGCKNGIDGLEGHRTRACFEVFVKENYPAGTDPATVTLDDIMAKAGELKNPQHVASVAGTQAERSPFNLDQPLNQPPVGDIAMHGNGSPTAVYGENGSNMNIGDRSSSQAFVQYASADLSVVTPPQQDVDLNQDRDLSRDNPTYNTLGLG